MSAALSNGDTRMGWNGSNDILDADAEKLEAEPLVSCIIPNYNNAELIGETITSCLEQTHAKLEIIVVDDGSTDGSIDVLQRFQGQIKVVRQKNRGVSVARNIGAHYSSGSLLCFCDSDDVWLPTKLERQIALMAQNMSASACHTDYEPFGSAVEGVNGVNESRRRYAVDPSSLLQQNRVILSSLMMRRSAFIRAGGFRAGLFYPADWMLWTALEELGPILYLDQVLIKYRMHGNNSSVQARLPHVLEAVAAKFFHRIMIAAKGAAGAAGEAEVRHASEHIDHEIGQVLSLLNRENAMHQAIRRFMLQLRCGFRLRWCVETLPYLLNKRSLHKSIGVNSK